MNPDLDFLDEMIAESTLANPAFPELMHAAARAAERTPDQVHPRNTLNDLPGNEWLYHTRSVLSTAYPHAFHHDLRKAHGANKPVQLMEWLIQTFTKRGMAVLDPFAGVGSTLIAGALTERSVTGIEINQKWVDIYHEVMSFYPGWQEPSLSMHVGDCTTRMQNWLEQETALFDFITFDPPYTIHLKQTMSGKVGSAYADEHANRRSDYDMRSDHTGDLANCADYTAYLERMGEVFRLCFGLLRSGRYLAFMVTNSYQNGEYTFTHVDLARAAQAHGFVPKGEIIWAPAGKRLRPYGYPTAWVPNPVHVSIVVLQKPPVPRVGKKKTT